MSDIKKLRKRIDKLDEDLLKTLKKRAATSAKIGIIKKQQENSSNLFRPERQIAILKRLLSKNNNQLEKKFIFNLWKNIFFFQTKLQGNINYICPNNTNKEKIDKITYALGEDIRFNFKKNIKSAVNELLNNSNSLLLLNHPGEEKFRNWWAYVLSKPIYVITAIPIYLEKNQKPEILVLSKNKPNMSKQDIILYTAEEKINKRYLTLSAVIKTKYFYESTLSLKSEKLTFFGAYSSIRVMKKKR